MGIDVNFACKTCKLDVYCGYTSYSRYDSLAEGLIEEHKTHDYLTYSTDWTYIKEGNLMVENHFYGDEVFVEGITSFTHLRLVE